MSLKEYINGLKIKEISVNNEELRTGYDIVFKLVSEQCIDPTVVGVKFKYTFKSVNKSFIQLSSLLPELDVISDIRCNKKFVIRCTGDNKDYISLLGKNKGSMIEIHDEVDEIYTNIVIILTVYILDVKERKHVINNW